MAVPTSSIPVTRRIFALLAAPLHAPLLVAACLLLLMASHHALAQPTPTDDAEPTLRENPGPGVNSTAIEILPLVSPDGRTLYFDRKYAPANTGGVDDDDDIYMATLQPDGSWGNAVNLGSPMNSPKSDVLFWISADGTTGLMHSGATVKTTIGKGKKAKTTEHTVGLSLIRRVNDAWAKPTPIIIQGLASLGDSYYATISPDGRKLILAYNTDHSNPDNLDLFVCTAITSDMTRWSEPTSLGSTINTPMFEGAPFMAADNRTLYFASAGHDGLGESDLFMTRRIGNSWNAWTTPVNLGPTINTPMFEASLSVPATGDYIYLSGSGFPGEDNFGRSDIYRLQLPQELRPIPATLVQGHLVAAGGKPVEGLVRVERKLDGLELFSTTSDHNGRFTLVLPPDTDVTIIGWGNGYDEQSQAVRTSAQPISGITLELTTASASGATMPETDTETAAIPVIYFPTGSAIITTDSERRLQSLARQYSRKRLQSITLVGFTDDEGEEAMNDSLSLRRANAVKAWLQQNGGVNNIPIQTIGKGENNPQKGNHTAAGKALNRRVEVVENEPR
ncbi:MAG: OmpA family protein [Chlorobi bacterium]|nr:OmpA family protein [Chlorobiota bacterium]